MTDVETGAVSTAVSSPEIEVTSTTNPVPEPEKVTEADTESTHAPDEDSHEEPEAEDSREEAQKKSGYKRKKEQAERLKAENEQLRAELERAKAPKEQKPASNDPEPTEADFDNEYDLIMAKARWAGRQEAKTLAQAQAEEQAKVREQSEFSERMADHEEREAVFIEQNPDYQEKLDKAATLGLVNEDGIKAVVKSDMSEQVAYHLLNHLDDMTVFNGLNAKGKEAAVKLIENHIKSNPKSAVRQTKAAPPITPVKPQGSSSKDPSDMSQNEYEKWRYSSR